MENIQNLWQNYLYPAVMLVWVTYGLIWLSHFLVLVFASFVHQMFGGQPLDVFELVIPFWWVFN